MNHGGVFRQAAVIALGLLVVPLVSRGGAQGAGDADWVQAVKEVHGRFTGRPGTLAQFGDSITVTQAFWAPLQHARKNASPEMERALQSVNAYLRPECWREWKGPEYGSDGGKTVRWAYENVDDWLRKLNPEVALIMFGTNDLHALELAEYREKLRAVVQKCLANGTVVILSTIPPRHGYEAKAAAFAQAAREIARELRLPLTDFHAEILRRRPEDWNGTREQFRGYEGYDVPTLISRDGVHPSYPRQYQGNYSEEALRCSGYGLRNYLALLKYAEVVEAIRGKSGKGTANCKLQIADCKLEDDRRGSACDSLQNATHLQSTGSKLAGGFIETDTLLAPIPQLTICNLQFAICNAFQLAAPRLPPPSGEVIRVASVEELFAAVARVRPGGTIMVADGEYRMPRRLEIRTDGVTLRGASGQRAKVVLDGGGMGELLAVTACSDVTIADLTVRNVRWNGIKINSETGVQRLTIHNCVLHNIWQRGVKGVKVPEADRERLRPKDCVIQYCLFTNDRPKQYSDDPADTPENFGGNYVGGIDVMYAKGWKIRDNVFRGIQGRTRHARGAIFIWHESEDCVIERNVIIDCDSGICLGNSHKPEDVRIHCTGFVVRNNFVTRAPENGILADYTRDCKILHNTIHDPQNRLGRLIRLVHDNDGLLVANNLLSGPPIRNESQSRIDFRGNLVQEMTTALVDPANGNLRLTARATAAIDRAVPLPEVTEDIDGKPRGARPDIGAHEFGAEGAL